MTYTLVYVIFVVYICNMLKNGIYVLRQDSTLSGDLMFKKDQEIEVVNKVIYMGGFMLPPGLQPVVTKWIENNLPLLKMDNRNF